MPPRKSNNFFDSDEDSASGEEDTHAQARARARPRPRPTDEAGEEGAGAGVGTGNAVAGPSRLGGNVARRGGGRAPPRLAVDHRSAGATGASSSSSPTTTIANTTFSRFQSTDDGNETNMTSFLPSDSYDPKDRPEHGQGMSDESDVLDEFAVPGYGEDDNDVKRLIRAWVRERGTVDLMRFEEDVVEDGMHKLEQHAAMLDLLRSDPSTSEEEHFKLMLVATESERVKYLIRGYLRCRVDKIEKYSQHISQTPQTRQLCSDIEWDHAKRYSKMVDQHFQSSVLNALPEWLRKMDDVGNDGLSMVRKPDKDVPVLIHCLRDCGDIILSDGTDATLDKDSMHLVAYRLIEKFVNRGWVEVL